jgi:PAS domain S-box-containing protein
VESSDDAILSKSLDGVITTWNRGAQRLFGYTAEEAIGRSVTMLIPADRHDEEPMILDRVRRGERIDHYETVRQRKDGSLVDISLTVSPIKDEDCNIVGASKIARDISDRKRGQQQQELLLREMDHRIKNLFALAVSVVSLSGRSASTVQDLVISARDRLTALARAHALTLSRNAGDEPEGAKPTTLHALIRAIVAPHEERHEGAPRFTVTGCDMEISGSAISSFALLLHEFATNSTKHGALSATKGQIQIHCANHGENVIIVWTERGGPAVAYPTGNSGFGEFLIRQTITGHLGGELSQDWKPEGLVVRVSIPRARLTG